MPVLGHEKTRTQLIKDTMRENSLKRLKFFKDKKSRVRKVVQRLRAYSIFVKELNCVSNIMSKDSQLLLTPLPGNSDNFNFHSI